MKTTTATRPLNLETAQPAQLPALRIPYINGMQERFNIDQTAWRVLVDATFPSAKTSAAVELALSYCKARNLDPFKKPVHIVPVWSTEKRGYVETIWPAISELRTTAMRTGSYAGCDPAIFGEDVTETLEDKVKRDEGMVTEKVTVTYPLWCSITLYRFVNGQRVAFPGPKVFWKEAYGKQGKSKLPNDMWAKRPLGQLEKCAEAAALRRAFPEEIGNEFSAEEMEGQIIDHEPINPKTNTPSEPKREDFKQPNPPKTEVLENETIHLCDEVGEAFSVPLNKVVPELCTRIEKMGLNRDVHNLLDNNMVMIDLLVEQEKLLPTDKAEIEKAKAARLSEQQ